MENETFSLWAILFNLFNVLVRYLYYVFNFVKFHDYFELLRIITYCYWRGLREQATQKDVKITCLELLRGTHGLRLVPPLGLHCFAHVLPLFVLRFIEDNKFDLIWFEQQQQQ